MRAFLFFLMLSGAAFGQAGPPMAGQIIAAVPIDHSGTCASTSVAQSLMSRNSARVGFQIMSGSDIWVSFTGTASAAYGTGSFKVPAGALYESPLNMRPIGSISIFCASTSMPYSATEW